MVKNCCAYGCKNIWSPNQNINYHRFPLNQPDLLKKWIEAVQLKDFTPGRHTLLCSQHFTTDSYSESTLNKKRLKRGAIPTIFSFPSYYQTNSSKRQKLEHVYESNEEIQPEGNTEGDTKSAHIIDVPTQTPPRKVDSADMFTQTSPRKDNVDNAKSREIKILRQRLQRRNRKIDNMKGLLKVLKETNKSSRSLKEGPSRASTRTGNVLISSNDDCYDSEPGMGSFSSVNPTCSASQMSSLIDTCTEDQKLILDEALARAIYSSTAPLSFVENPYFIDFLKLIRPAYIPPSRFALSNNLLETEYNSVTDSLTTMINDAESITLLCHGWADTNGISLMNVVMATPAPIFIKCIDSVIERHTPEYLFSVFDSIITENPSIHAVCTNNTTTNRAVWRLLLGKYLDLTTYGCAASCINLLVKELCNLGSISTTFKSAKVIIKFFRNKRICKQALRKAQIDQIGKEMTLVPVCESRWNTTYKSLKSLLTNREVIRAAVIDENLQNVSELAKIKEFVLDNQFWDRVFDCSKILEPIAAAINTLKGDSYCPISHVFPLHLEIEEALKEHMQFLTQREQEYVLKIINDKEVLLLKDIHIAAYLLHPQLKGEKLNDSQFLQASEYIVKIGSTMGFQEGDVLNELLNFHGKLGFWQSNVLWRAAEKCNPIAWWKGMCRNKKLSTIAARILNFPATTATCERKCKVLSPIKTQKRNRLTVQKTEKLLNIKYNLNLVKQPTQNARKKRPRRCEKLKFTYPPSRKQNPIKIEKVTSEDQESNSRYSNNDSSEEAFIDSDELVEDDLNDNNGFKSENLNNEYLESEIQNVEASNLGSWENEDYCEVQSMDNDITNFDNIECKNDNAIEVVYV